MQEKLLDTAKTAELLGISKASVRNWMKHGYLQAIDPRGRFFEAAKVLALKEALQEGKIDRLKRRANKVQAQRDFIPAEYIQNKQSRLEISRLIGFMKRHRLEKRMAILVLALNLFYRQGDIKTGNLVRLLAFDPKDFTRKCAWKELREFYGDISGYPENQRETESYITEDTPVKELERTGSLPYLEYLFRCPLPPERDLLGIVFQSLTEEGKKARLGAYFTPSELVDRMVKENALPGQKVLDPCCGTGQFLLSFADLLQDPEGVWGIDVDLMSVRIARLNLLLKFPGEFTPRIFHLNSLEDILFPSGEEAYLFRVWEQEKAIPDPVGISNDFDLVATNPPWGAKLPGRTLQKLRREFPEITSGESFAYFLRISLALLKEGGRLSFVLPEAILNVRAHADIRQTILQHCRLKRIECLKKRFKNVLSPVIRLDLVKAQPLGDEKVFIQTPEEEYLVSQQRFLENKWHVFDVYLSDRDEKIVSKVYRTEHTTLKGKADWALGIVTGDNRKFISEQKLEGYEPIYKGSDVDAFALKEAHSFIKFTPGAFQQAAPEEKYRTREKLIYRFISAVPVLAYDNQGSLTLNSANVLIPHSDYPLKVILALFNSSLYGFLYLKKFHSLKILRGDLEQLPLPLWEEKEFRRITGLVDRVLQGQVQPSQLDEYLMDLFGLSADEQAYVQASIKKQATWRFPREGRKQGGFP